MAGMLAWRLTGLTPLDSRDNCANYLMRYQDTTNCRIIKILMIKARVGVVSPMGAVAVPACNAISVHTFNFRMTTHWCRFSFSANPTTDSIVNVRLLGYVVKSIEYYIACLYAACCYLSVCQWRTMFIIQGRSFIHLAGEISLYHFFHAKVIHFIHS